MDTLDTRNMTLSLAHLHLTADCLCHKLTHMVAAVKIQQNRLPADLYCLEIAPLVDVQRMLSLSS